MLIYKITGIGVKDFMAKLLKEDVFDSFEVRGVEISTFTKFEISGILYKDFIQGDKEGLGEYCTWQILRPIVFSLLKGKERPKNIKIILSASSDLLQKIHENASAMFLNFMFENDEIMLTTATSEKNFTMDKAVNISWEHYVENFFRTNSIQTTKEE